MADLGLHMCKLECVHASDGTFIHTPLAWIMHLFVPSPRKPTDVIWLVVFTVPHSTALFVLSYCFYARHGQPSEASHA